MKLSVINAVIFDECHHALEEHPYHDIMSLFDECSPDEQPHILGLTSSLLVGKFLPMALEKILNDLECTLKSNIETAINVQSVSRYGTKPKEIVIECEPYEHLTVCCNELMNVLNETLCNLERYRSDTSAEEDEDPTLLPRQAIQESIRALNGIGPLGLKLMLRYVRKKCSLECGLHLKEGESIWSLRLVAPKFRKLINVLQSFKPQMDHQSMCNNDQRGDGVRTPRAGNPAADINVWEEEEDEESPDEDEEEERRAGGKDSSLCGIVFADGRFTAFVLDTLLRKFQKSNPNLGFISSCSIMGHETTGLGVDVPRCNLVVRFDPPMQYRSYIQSKARARAHSSYFIMLVDRAKKDHFTQDLHDFREIDKILQNKCHFREADVGDRVDAKEVDRMLPPLMPRKEEGSPKVTMSGAITLVNRYCAKLPSDSFTHLTPTWQITCVNEDNGKEGRYLCTLHLPINSPLRDPIMGCEMPTKKMAKMSAALGTCERLYQVGELNDHLLPVGKETILEASNIQGELEEDDVDNDGRPDSRMFSGHVTITGHSVLPLRHLHGPIRTSTSGPERQRKETTRPQGNTKVFWYLDLKIYSKGAIISSIHRDGELAVSVNLVTSDITLTSCQIDQAKAFHQCIFSDVLRLQKPNILYDPQTDKSTYIILPLNKDDKSEGSPVIIDWPFLKKVSDCARALDHPPSLPNYSKQEFIFDSELYEDAVVTPIYRNIDQPQRYFVADILNETLVTSPFPSDRYEKYVDYFFERYEIEISNFRQPLLDVDCMSSRLNLLTPRYLNHKGKALPIGSKQAKKSNAQKKQYLVPELCYVYPIPASMWRKAICLPSILYRLNSLLVAEELRVLLAQEAAIGSVQVPASYPTSP
ncbi:Dicer [Apostichopus japonicus]|uniref:Dicer n=1 Tax=Stichopus japonicus TaxID=307972 RepID=A0A2G8L573_STIJA|nr:Dicer [Apostichopus japonicus]